MRSHEHLQCGRDGGFCVLADAVLVPRRARQRESVGRNPLRQTLPGLARQRRPRRGVLRMPRRDLRCSWCTHQDAPQEVVAGADGWCLRASGCKWV